MINELIKDMEELLQYKKKYESAIKDKQTMSNLLYEYMLKEYENTPKEERIANFKLKECVACKFCFECDYRSIPDDVGKPIPSNDGWIPNKKRCEDFQWS